MTHARTMTPASLERLQIENTALRPKLAMAQAELAMAQAELAKLRTLLAAQDQRLAKLEHVIGNEWTGDM